MAIEPPIINSKTDEELIALIIEGEHNAFTELVKRHAYKYYCVAYRMTFNKNDAEDIVQEAFLKLWNKPQQWNKTRNTKFSTWFYRVVANLCIDYNKKKKPIQIDEKVIMIDNKPPTDVIIDTELKQQMLKKCILELPERQQLALTLCFYEGVSNKEAADILGVHLKALQSLLIRAKSTLKDKMQKLRLQDGY